VGNFDGIDIPTVAATVDTVVTLSNGVLSGDTGLTARFKIDWRPGTYDPDNVIVVGAHLDSVGSDPGSTTTGRARR
jgi:hypothetical protein